MDSPQPRRRVDVDAHTAAVARPGLRILTAGEEALSHACSSDAQYGHLAISPATAHCGYPLGRWLAGQRSRQRRGVLSAEREQALAGIDPWWCPPWDLKWQRCYHRAQRATRSRFLRASC
ncbi:helicase associated domain-containing protein [Streptomyces sp. NPDC001674]|uniref:helicase associated domain-containing protein n=1 Tax=Streptomyces sp. NPDC001674 TaxID=3154394 RepID=UPI003333FC9E